MAVSNIKATFQCDIKKIWEIITSFENYSWRSDLSKIEILDKNKFLEYTKDGCITTFTVTATEPYQRWEFDMENSNMRGHWIGIFSYENGKTTIDFTEDVSVKKVIMKPFLGMYLNKQQATYVSDLKKAVFC
ncbi:polyketide cyclase [Clostridium botulinum]|uniref:Polyketide cyclase n=1 Tax=Clostridium botulinum TaxID=1491 RepID=A0A6B4JKC6_CLOBO|nr:hypothetical protein [Clostridium botulinum]EES48001.1 conserved hypothetical protein [Clostridium botulinum E1 str. 'BoNT E Beluga']MBY6760172.1 polyketide cyclase [Clostridium botulinum]MBY6919080.1 polyketide cyclase [Clostridium botulinum]MCR1132195.1 polyketide cyclase [Clostridium botulinum]NFJ57277.1 polyketide cyclase [Clostridium botulinum]